MIKQECVVLVFSKEPIPGTVKTRLQPGLSAAGAADLYRELLDRTLRTITGGRPDWDTQLWCTPGIEHPVFDECRDSYGVELRLQSGADIGARMHNALADSLSDYRMAILVGCDIPDLQFSDLLAGRQKLAEGFDAVLGPAADGGYYLIGMRTALPELFTGMDWGTPAVLDATRRRLRDLRLRYHELPERWDLDGAGDLQKYHAVMRTRR